MDTNLDPNIVFNSGEFTLPNGDMYIGEYCAHRQGLIWREGHGKYITQDGHTYEGEWKDDKLIENKVLVIRYSTGEVYEGCLKGDKYNGSGTYTLGKNMTINCNFVDNQPNGNIVLVDNNQHIWEGAAELNRALLIPENEFYSYLKKSTGVGPFMQEEPVEAPEPEEEIVSLPLEPTSSEIFKKSTKTVNDVDFSNSKWYKRYNRYRNMKDAITVKLLAESKTSLTDEEKKWYRKYRKHLDEKKEASHSPLKKEHLDTDLLDTFYSKEFKDSSTPLKVFYPTPDWFKDEDMMNSSGG